MQNGKQHHSNIPGELARPTLTITALIQILQQRKKYLILSVAACLTLAVLYSFLATPVYEASTLIKKENTGKANPDGFDELMEMQTLDEVETEVELLKTRSVLEKVINELGMQIFVEKIEYPDNSIEEFNLGLLGYHQMIEGMGDYKYPIIRINKMDWPAGLKNKEYYIEAQTSEWVSINDAEGGELITAAQLAPNGVIALPMIELDLQWKNVSPGTKIYFRVDNPVYSLESLKKKITVSPVKTTNIFKVSVRSTSAATAQLIANKLAEKFRETRYEHKNQTLNYSFNFVDEQLQEVSQNLKNAEQELSDFKSKNRITMIDETSREMVNFLSQLEAEKVRADLELAEYQNKFEALKTEMKERGFFDQTYLTPNETDRTASPFSVLMRQLSDTELERLQLLQKRTENHPDIVALDERIAEIKEKLSRYNQNTITAYDIIIQSNLQKQRDLRNLIYKYSGRVRNLPQQQSQLLEIMRRKNVYEKVFNLLLDKREEMRIAKLSKLQDIVIVDQAYMPTKPVLPKKSLNVLVGLMMGISVGLGLIFVREFLSGTVQNPAELEASINAPIMAIFPKYEKATADKIEKGFTLANHIEIITDSQLGFVESYRLMRTRLDSLPPERNVLFFTSCEEDTGKTTVVSNFAVSLALAGKKVLVVDGDLRKAMLGVYFQLPERPEGLIDYLKKKSTSPNPFSLKLLSDDQERHLKILACGGRVDNSSELLSSNRFRQYIAANAKLYDYVLIDTPPITQTVDALVLGSFVKDAILVVRPNLTHKRHLQRALKEFKELQSNIVGVVVNGYDGDPNYYGYGYGYGKTYAPTFTVENSKVDPGRNGI